MTEPFVRPPTSSPRRRAKTERPSEWAKHDDDRCSVNCGAMRCMLTAGHEGVHAWRSLGELRVFEWS